jgi:hypothetical protein
MTRKMSQRGAGGSLPDGAGSSDADEQDGGRPSVGRRALLTRGGVVAAGVVGAGAVATAVAGPASAQVGDPVLMATANDAGDGVPPTELTAENAGVATFIVVNEGIDTSNNGAGPNVRLELSSATGTGPATTTVGGDLTATQDGLLWFTHQFLTTTGDIVPAPVLTEETGNVFAPLGTPTRILDTRSATGRANIVNPSGNLDSAGRLLAGKTIYINLDTLVFYAEAVLANVTVVDPTSGGYLILWSGVGATPTVSQINFAKANPALANFVSVEVAEHSTTVANAIAIHAAGTTQVILDVFAFIMPGFEYARYSLTPAGTTAAQRAARLQRARAAVNAAKQS